MTEGFQKVKPIKYNLGNGSYVYTVPTVNGLHCWGYIGGEHVQFEDKDLKAIETRISDYSTEANKEHTKKAMKHEEVALRVKENGLEKTSQQFNAPKNDLDWPKE